MTYDPDNNPFTKTTDPRIPVGTRVAYTATNPDDDLSSPDTYGLPAGTTGTVTGDDGTYLVPYNVTLDEIPTVGLLAGLQSRIIAADFSELTVIS